ncbi:MAG: ABC transporter permease subunit, partial [Pseudomonadota bacterium]
MSAAAPEAPVGIGAQFVASPRAMISAAVALLLILSAAAAPMIAPHDPFALGTFNLMDSELPPVWAAGGDPRFLLGTDTQGRDVLSAILYGMRVSLIVGFAAVALSAGVGTLLGLVAGYRGGWLDGVLMRIADVILSFPTILIALLVS